MSKSVDTAIRILVAVPALGAILLAFVAVSDAVDNSREPPILRVAALSAVGFGMGFVAAQLRDPLRERTPLVPRRRGRPAPDAPPAPHVLYPLHPSSPLRIALDTTRSAIAGLIGLVMAPTLWSLGAAGLASLDEFERAAVVWMIALAGSVWSGLLSVRSALRVLTGARAVTVDHDAIRLGWALGYVPPLTIPRSDVAVIATHGGDDPAALIVTTAGRAYELRGRHLAGPDPVAQIARAWPEHDAGSPPEPPVVVEVAPAQPGTPDASLIAGTFEKLHRRRNIARLVMVVGGVALIAVSGWYLVQRTANDRLLGAGMVTRASVTDWTEGRLLIPSLLELRYDVGNESITGVVASGPFSGWDRSNLGQTLTILVDRHDVTQIRFPDQRNYDPRTWFPGLIALGAVLIGIALMRQHTRALSISEDATWCRRTFRVTKSGFAYSVALAGSTRGADGTHERWTTVGLTNGTKKSLGVFEGWVGEAGGGYVFVTETPFQVMTVLQPRRRRNRTIR